MITKFGAKKLKTSLFRVMQKVFRYLEPFRRGSRVWRTDRPTDIIITNAALSYVAQLKRTLSL